MSKRDETLQRAYGSMPKEVGYNITWDFIPTLRGVKYYWHKLIRKLQGRGSKNDSCDCGHSH